jgi:acyl-coenzyme A synthetase/AMP-(fatty) acid ligase
MHAAHTLRACLPQTRYVVNLCANRYGFLVAFIAAVLNRQQTLLPPNQAAATLRDLLAAYPDQHTLDDTSVAALLANAKSPIPAAAVSASDWHILPDRIVAITFTSGSTGTPQPHTKTWRTLTTNARLIATELFGGVRVGIVATVPPQHVYGLETSVISALATQCAVYDERPFFPGDIRTALESVPTPRTLVTTPMHLRTLLDSGTELPSLTRIVSATAPLTVALAARAEALWSAPVYEIYGCTEAGIMAWRRTILEQPWSTFTGGTLQVTAERAQYLAPQLPNAIDLQDHIESLSPTEFYLLGRATDMIKVAGKRGSLQALTQALLDIQGVHDAVVFVPDTDARPAALVVAPTLSSARIATLLADRIDPVFVPRPLLVVATLPRNGVGKLPHAALLQLLKDAQ